MKMVLFTNPTQERFAHPEKGGVDEHCKWNNVPLSFEPGESKYLEVGQAKVLAKHLISKVLHAKGLDGLRGKSHGDYDPLGDQRIQPNHVAELFNKIINMDSSKEVSSVVDLQTLALEMAADNEKIMEMKREAEKDLPEPEKDDESVVALRSQLEGLGGKVDKRWNVERLQKEIKKVQKANGLGIADAMSSAKSGARKEVEFQGL